MVALLVILLLLALLFGGLGFAVHALWWIAIFALIILVISWATGRSRL